MELILKSNNEQSLAKIIALAKKLDVTVEAKQTKAPDDAKEVIRQRILNFRTTSASPFGDALEWQNDQRQDRDLPFS